MELGGAKREKPFARYVECIEEEEGVERTRCKRREEADVWDGRAFLEVFAFSPDVAKSPLRWFLLQTHTGIDMFTIGYSCLPRSFSVVCTN